MSSSAIEVYLARLYSDKDAREKFLADPEGTARNAGLSEADSLAMSKIDSVGLRMAGASYSNKRAQHRRPRRRLVDALLTLLGKR